MRDSSSISEENDISKVVSCISQGIPYEHILTSPKPENREFLKSIALEYLRKIDREKDYNLLCLCLEEIISNSVKANIKRAYFIINNLDINNHDDYVKGMKNFKELGVCNMRDPSFVEKINKLGLYVIITFKFVDGCVNITTRNNSVISKEEIERIEKKLKLSENQSPEDIFMNSIDMTEGAGLGIIMIKKIMKQISRAEDCFSIRASETETITELKILP